MCRLLFFARTQGCDKPHKSDQNAERECVLTCTLYLYLLDLAAKPHVGHARGAPSSTLDMLLHREAFSWESIVTATLPLTNNHIIET